MSLRHDIRYEEEIADLRAALKKAQQAEYKAKRKNEDIVDAVYRAAKDGSLAVGRGKPVAPAKDARKVKAEVAVVHATDWQLGKKTVSYDMATCAARIDQLVEKTIHLTKIQRADHPVRELVLMLGGDMVEGITIFPGQAWEVEAHLFEQLFEASKIMERMVRTFAENYEKVSIVCEYGNHRVQVFE